MIATVEQGGASIMDPARSHHWEPIADLPVPWDDIVDSEIEAYVAAWLEERDRYA